MKKTSCLFVVLGSFELAIVRLSRLIDINRDHVLYGDVVLPIRECVHARYVLYNLYFIYYTNIILYFLIILKNKTLELYILLYFSSFTLANI